MGDLGRKLFDLSEPQFFPPGKWKYEYLLCKAGKKIINNVGKVYEYAAVTNKSPNVSNLVQQEFFLTPSKFPATGKELFCIRTK